jgi:hypothetical protein
MQSGKEKVEEQRNKNRKRRGEGLRKGSLEWRIIKLRKTEIERILSECPLQVSKQLFVVDVYGYLRRD